MIPVFNFSCRKIGGIWFVKLGRFGFNFYVSRHMPERMQVQQVTPWEVAG